MYLCSDEYVGIIFVIAMAICNWKASLLAVWGSIVGTLFAVLIGVDLDRIYLGLHSYNSTLTMVGVGCIFATLNKNNFIMAIFHSIICVLIEVSLITMMAPSGIPYLTLPFCLSTMFFAVFAYRKKQEAAIVNYIGYVCYVVHHVSFQIYTERQRQDYHYETSTKYKRSSNKIGCCIESCQHR